MKSKFIIIRRKYWDENCKFCLEQDPLNSGVMFPPHEASESCESGKHEHCTCDVCF
ncbi:MAG: hypothetical protein AABY22_10590 [Nanoarchaeota archaeon]